MKTWFMQLALVVTATVASLVLCPTSATAGDSQSAENPALAPEVVQPVQVDFSDIDFDTADQPEIGGQLGGDVIMVEGHGHGNGGGQHYNHGGWGGGEVFIGGGLSLVVLVVVLIIIL
jgi:hypothetical protein